jgi:hypothetical protein
LNAKGRKFLVASACTTHNRIPLWVIDGPAFNKQARQPEHLPNMPLMATIRVENVRICID